MDTDTDTGGPGYVVRPEALVEAARGITDALAELAKIGTVGAASAGRGVGALVLDPRTLGHAGLARAFGEFRGRWDWGVRELMREGQQIAEGLGHTATAYQQVERGAESILKPLFLDAFANPTADPASASRSSWGELLEQAKPDTSAEAAQHAGEHITRTIKEAATDLADYSR